jgi:hypothetical protein
VAWIRYFVPFHGYRRPRDLVESHIAEFLSDLAADRPIRLANSA